jgi:hypothetical protein
MKRNDIASQVDGTGRKVLIAMDVMIPKVDDGTKTTSILDHGLSRGRINHGIGINIAIDRDHTLVGKSSIMTTALNDALKTIYVQEIERFHDYAQWANS